MIYSQTFYQILYFSLWKENSEKNLFSENFNISDNNINQCWTGPGTNIEGPNGERVCQIYPRSVQVWKILSMECAKFLKQFW